MAAPWEKYQQTSTTKSTGPWSKFAAPAEQAPAPSQYGSAVPQLDPTGAPIRQEAIPGQRQPSRGMLDFAVGLPEAALTLGSGIIAGTVAPYVAAGEEILSGQYGTGTPETERRATELTQKYTYQPTSRTGQELVGAAGEAMQSLNLPPVPGAQGITAAAMAPAALRQSANVVGREAGYLSQAAKQIPAITARNEANIAQSYANAPQIEAAQLAKQYGIALDPAVSNPTARNRLRSATVGDVELDLKLAKQNEPKWTAAAKDALGIDKKARLNSPSVYDAVRAREDISGPYNAVREIPSITVTDDALKSLGELRVQPLFGDAGEAKRVNSFLDKLEVQLSEGGSGDKLLDSIRDLRNQAQKIYAQDKANAPISNKNRMVADAKMDASKILESLIEENIPQLGARDAFRQARIKMAETYDLQSATDFGAERINPQKLAKKVSEGRVPYTGIVNDLGRIAAVFPEIANTVGKGPTGLARLTRASLGGAAGGIIGSLVGGPVGGAVGIALGSGGSDAARRVLANRMLRPEYQASRAMPRDFRPQTPVNALRPVEPGQSNIVPFDPRMAVMEPEAQGPNFTMQQDPIFGTTPSTFTAQRGLPNEMPRQLYEAQQRAELAQGFREAAERKPAGSGMVLDLDPITGRLQSASRGLPGATLETFEDYGASLNSAADKLSRGQRFALTADEMVAWNRTSVELAELMPGMKTLSQKAIAEKMMDRKWVEGALTKAREKEAAFKEIEMRTRDADMLRQSREARERLMDVVETLEDSLRQPRAKEGARSKGQGPKTRAAKNQLGQVETLNKLID